MRFTGRVGFITGGAIGFGRAFARQLVREGAAVAVIDTNAGQAERTAQELRDAGGKAIAVRCDVSDEAQVAKAVAETAERVGPVDLLINNAARHFKHYGQPFSKLSHAEIREVFDVNVMGTVNCSLAVREPMVARGGGAIVNIASHAGHRVQTVYGVSKLAIRGLTAAFADDFASSQIRVNAVSPGLMATENALHEYSPEHFQESIDRHQLIKRQGTMSDVVSLVMFLASDEASFITGQTVLVNGGRDLYI